MQARQLAARGGEGFGQFFRGYHAVAAFRMPHAAGPDRGPTRQSVRRRSPEMEDFSRQGLHLVPHVTPRCFDDPASAGGRTANVHLTQTKTLLRGLIER